MGFEVSYNYYEKLENSFDYNRDESKTFKKIYGKAVEDFPLEKLAVAIQQQMSRRDIFVYDFEIYEFQKKKISWRQNKSDLIIKNKRFTNKGEISDFVDESDPVETNSCHPPEYNTCEVNTPRPTLQLINLADNNRRIAKPQSSNSQVAERVLRKVVFLPSKMNAPIGFFTINNSYPVFKEILNTNGIGLMIETLDDKGTRVRVPDEHFVPAGQSLVGGNEIDFDSKGGNLSDDGLNWGGAVKDNIPKLR